MTLQDACLHPNKYAPMNATALVKDFYGNACTQYYIVLAHVTYFTLNKRYKDSES